jgi:hypothetical protein
VAIRVKEGGLSERDNATRFSASGFFHESVSLKPLSIPLGPFQIFLKICRQKFATQDAPLVSLTPVANRKKSSIRKVIII